jgi:hypothetical protein
MWPSAVAAMAAALGADRPDGWLEGCNPEARRSRITTAPQYHLMLMTAMVAKLISIVSARAMATAMAP